MVSKGVIEAIPTGVGHQFHSEEFLVPGEERGSKRYALPKGIHFRLSPARIDKESCVIDVLLSHTTIDSRTDDGFFYFLHRNRRSPSRQIRQTVLGVIESAGQQRAIHVRNHT